MFCKIFSDDQDAANRDLREYDVRRATRVLNGLRIICAVAVAGGIGSSGGGVCRGRQTGGGQGCGTLLSGCY